MYLILSKLLINKRRKKGQNMLHNKTWSDTQNNKKIGQWQWNETNTKKTTLEKEKEEKRLNIVSIRIWKIVYSIKSFIIHLMN